MTEENALTRRDFIIGTGMAGFTGLTALRSLSAQQEPTSDQYQLERIGLALYTVRKLAARDFERTLKEVAAIGYRDLDMYIYESKREAKETRAILDATGLTCPSARVNSSALYRGWERYLEAANTLGASWITLSGLAYEERRTLQDWQELSELFNRAGRVAREHGLTFCYHNHAFEFEPIEGQVPMDLLLARTDQELVKLQMDVYWMTKGGRDAALEISRLGSRVATLHLKDMDATPQKGITTVGRGTIDFARIISAASVAGVKHYFVEEDSPADEMTAVREAYTHISNLRLSHQLRT